MNYVSVFDILKIGVGPSSSHTLGPWRAARFFLRDLQLKYALHEVTEVRVKLYGSLALTGKGHGTDIAILLGLHDFDPETVDISIVRGLPSRIKEEQTISLGNQHIIEFDPDNQIEFLGNEQLVYHPNGVEFYASVQDGDEFMQTYFSVGGGFVVREDEFNTTDQFGQEVKLPYNIIKADEIATICEQKGVNISDIILENEQCLHKDSDIIKRLDLIWKEMFDCMYRGCITSGILPGGLNVKRRAFDLYQELAQDSGISNSYQSVTDWLQEIKQKSSKDFETILEWISCFAMAVNEENANFGRVVTAPTNGASGVIPAVLAYLVCFTEVELNEDLLRKFLLTSGAIGGLYKNGATISAAMGGCQAEIGVSSSMAAVALTEALGGSSKISLMAGEIAMEHHLGLTCDPVRGLVQIPCIERNTMGAIKAITACHLALKTNPDEARVSLDSVIHTMWETAQDMNQKYKETSLGGLATNISVIVPEC